MDIKDQYLVIQVYDNHLIYSVVMPKYSAVISEIFIIINFNTSDNDAKYSDITVQYVDIRAEFMRCLLDT